MSVALAYARASDTTLLAVAKLSFGRLRRLMEPSLMVGVLLGVLSKQILALSKRIELRAFPLDPYKQSFKHEREQSPPC